MPIESFAWDSPAADEARRIRFAVFVDEQRVPPEEEIDAIDPEAHHVLLRDDEGRAVATGRLFPSPEDPSSGRIGRMAVAADARGRGHGRAVLLALMREGLDRGFRRLVLDAQVHALPFYERYGFEPFGERHLDAGIEHQFMVISARDTEIILSLNRA